MSTTQLDAEVIERIVREVIRRLLDRGHNIVAETAPAEPTTDFQLTDRLVTLETLRDRLDGVRRLVVRPGTIVTPAVLDELKDRGIELVKSGQ